MRRTISRDEQWIRLDALLPGKVSERGRTGADKRRFVEAVLRFARKDSPWRDLTEAFCPWNSGYEGFAR